MKRWPGAVVRLVCAVIEVRAQIRIIAMRVQEPERTALLKLSGLLTTAMKARERTR